MDLNFKDILYEKKDGVAKIIINRPKRYNAFTGLTLQEMVFALLDSWGDKSIGVVVLTGAGDKAFCTGGDLQTKDDAGYTNQGAQFDLTQGHSMLFYLLRAIPKPVLAAVNGFAIGGGNVMHVVCDLVIASDNARFGQAGPNVGSFDAGFGTIFLSRLVGERKAREIWYLCHQYSADEALQMGLINKVVPQGELEAETDKWCKEMLGKAPEALACLKASFNADTDHVIGIDSIAMRALGMYYQTEESHEGLSAFLEKRKPDFTKFRK